MRMPPILELQSLPGELDGFPYTLSHIFKQFEQLEDSVMVPDGYLLIEG